MAKTLHEDGTQCYWDYEEKQWSTYLDDGLYEKCLKDHQAPRHNEDPEDLSGWRMERGEKWYKELGWAFLSVVQSHRYDYADKGDKPDDPGWHVCTCRTWQGYWTGFDTHVTNHLRKEALENYGAAQWPTKKN